MNDALRLHTLRVAVDLVTEVCCACGGVFAIPDTLKADLLKSHRRFYCPAGHGQSYMGQSEAERLRDELAAEQRRTTRLGSQLDQAYAETAALEKARRKLEREARAAARRTTNGACTMCHRHFVNVERHMKSKHADQVVSGGATQA